MCQFAGAADVTQFDGTYTGAVSSTGLFTLTVNNGEIQGVTTTGAGSGPNLPGTYSGTVSQSGAVTMSGVTGNGCVSPNVTGTFTFAGQATVTSSTGATMTGTWIQPPLLPCGLIGAGSGSWTANRVSTPAFPMVVSGSIDANVANVSAAIQYRPQDVGTVGSVFVFALAPKNLVTGGPVAKDAAATCVLAQLDSNGHLISASASTLVPYVSGVLSSQGQAITILNNVPTPQVAGATFFVGYGTNASTMLNTGVDRSAVTVPGSVQCPESIATAPGALSGLWWNSTESGWGINFTQRGNVVFAAWYTYDGLGNPKWYVAPRCALPAAAASGNCTETLYEVNGPTFFGTAFDPSAKQVSAVGSLQLSFANANAGSMTYTVAGQTRTVAIARQPFPSGTTAPPVDFTDLWWNPSESGWGLAITHQFNVMFLAWYVYDGAGKPVWYVASNCNVNASQNGCTGTLYRTTAPAFGPALNPLLVQVFTAGTVNVVFTDANNGTLTYTVAGVTSSEPIARQLF